MVRDNIGKVVERGERLDELDERAGEWVISAIPLYVL